MPLQFNLGARGTASHCTGSTSLSTSSIVLINYLTWPTLLLDLKNKGFHIVQGEDERLMGTNIRNSISHRDDASSWDQVCIGLLTYQVFKTTYRERNIGDDLANKPSRNECASLEDRTTKYSFLRSETRIVPKSHAANVSPFTTVRRSAGEVAVHENTATLLLTGVPDGNVELLLTLEAPVD